MWNLLIGPISEVVNTVLKRVLPPEKMSEAERANIEKELTLALASQDFQAHMAQLGINLEEAKHENVFIAGWRPAAGWVCVTGFGLHYVAFPMLTWARAYFGWSIPALPVFDMSTLQTLLYGMLGIGAYRSFEKWQGVNKGR